VNRVAHALQIFPVRTPRSVNKRLRDERTCEACAGAHGGHRRRRRRGGDEFFFFFFLGICGPVPFFQYKIILNEKRCRLNKGIFGKFEPKDAHAAHVV